MGTPQPYSTIITVLGVMIAIQDIIFILVFIAVAIKTRWEIKVHSRNGLMIHILKLSIASAFKWFSSFLIIINATFRTLPDYPLWITPVVFFVDFSTATWLVITMYNIAYVIIHEKEEDHEQPAHL